MANSGELAFGNQITRIKGNISTAYTKLQSKGATMPGTQNSANLGTTIDSIIIGGDTTPPNEIDVILAGTYNLLTEEVCQAILTGTYEYVAS